MPNLPSNHPSSTPSVRCRTSILFLWDGEGVLDVKYLVFQHQPDLRGIGDSNLVRFLLPSGNLDVEVVWLLATHQEMVQNVRMPRTRALELLLVNL